ncbi:MAG: ATP-grasp domain-containing protein [Desulfotignum sp.]|nr:ATP-grasp domain-containing protein [Desulfotignum sp.]
MPTTDMSAARSTPRVLVVGTTADYIEWIRTRYPDEALFITAPSVRQSAQEPVPDPSEELVCDLTDTAALMNAVTAHMNTWSQTPAGIACFDCESMITAARLARTLGLSYPGESAILNCRDKLISKQLWQAQGVSCPRVWPVHGIEDVMRILKDVTAGLVLKPAWGSGSELVFQCGNRKEAETAWQTMTFGLEKRKKNALFAHPDQLILAEERICGPEYSADFILTNTGLTLIRLARKMIPAGMPFGTAAGYEVPGILPLQLPVETLASVLEKAARALGLETGICMVDFVINHNRPYLLEITPRPGGDCLPWLLDISGHLDILKLTLDVAGNRLWDISAVQFSPHMALRIHAGKHGILRKIDYRDLASEPRVKQIHLIRKPGHRIVLPPDDYDSWLLGHVIFDTYGWNFPETRCSLLIRRLEIEIQP